MKYMNDGSTIFGTGTLPVMQPFSFRKRESIFKDTPTEWRQTTIGALVHAAEDAHVGKYKESELAFYVKTHTDVTDFTRCAIGTARRGKVLMCNGFEYRAHEGTLHTRRIDK